jgi:hypothetical protein
MHVRDEEEIRLVMFEHVGWMGSEAKRVSRVANLQQPRSTHSQVHRCVPKYSHTGVYEIGYSSIGTIKTHTQINVTRQDSKITYAQQ